MSLGGSGVRLIRRFYIRNYYCWHPTYSKLISSIGYRGPYIASPCQHPLSHLSESFSFGPVAHPLTLYRCILEDLLCLTRPAGGVCSPVIPAIGDMIHFLEDNLLTRCSL